MTTSLFSNQEFLAKLATTTVSGSITQQDYEQMLDGFLNTMKTAGANPLEVYGFLLGIAEIGGGEEFSKAAGISDFMTGTGAVVKKVWDNPGAAVSGMLHHPIDTVQKGLTTGGNAMAGSVLHNEHPGIDSFLTGLNNGDSSQNGAIAKMWHDQNYSGVGSKLWEMVQGNNLVKKWAPTVIPGIATMAAGKMMGMGWGGSALLGAAVGGAAGSQTGQNFIKKLTNPAPAPAGSATAAAGASAASATPPATPGAQQNMATNAANATNVGAQVSHPDKPPTVAPATPVAAAAPAAGAAPGAPPQPLAPGPMVPEQPPPDDPSKIASAETLSPVEFGEFLDKVASASPAILNQILGATGGLTGAAAGGLIGGAAGALVPSTEDDGKTHRLRNAFIGAGVGATAGGFGGAAVGDAVAQAKNQSMWGRLTAPKRTFLQRMVGQEPSMLETLGVR